MGTKLQNVANEKTAQNDAGRNEELLRAGNWIMQKLFFKKITTRAEHSQRRL